MRKNYIIFILIILVVSAVSCTKFTKIMKEPDPEKRYDAAIEYYNNGECLKSLTILEDLLPLFRGVKKSEDVFYYFAKSQFCEKDYLLAGFYMKQFVKTFPQSKYSEECLYLGALCAYKESPGNSLDQSETDQAIGELQVFLDKYPTSEKKDTISSLIYNLNNKLEIKDYNNAALYQQTLNYKSAVIAYSNFLREYPATPYREDVMFRIIQSNYLLAVNSIESKKEERLKETIKSYDNFAVIFSESGSITEAMRFKELAERELEKRKDN